MDMRLEWFKSIEDDQAYHQWLESSLFNDDCFDDSVFEASRTLYHVELRDSLMEDAIYQGIEPATFQKSDLNDAVRNASLDCYGHAASKWFHVNVHDNIARVVEKFGNYSFRDPLVPIYILLQHHQADEGGTTYAGVASAHREWVLLFQDALHISAHGEARFVDRVCERLEVC